MKLKKSTYCLSESLLFTIPKISEKKVKIDKN